MKKEGRRKNIEERERGTIIDVHHSLSSVVSPSVSSSQVLTSSSEYQRYTIQHNINKNQQNHSLT